MGQRAILHVDMDAFYAAIEQRDHAPWRGRPVVVGGPRDGRGVVSAASYEARRYGIHSAMPSRTAAARCPEAVFVRPRMAYYVGVSERLHEIFQRFTPLVEGLSLDEAFLDVTAYRRVHGEAPRIAGAIQEAIARELELSASVGVAPNKFLAKLGSDLEKPHGLVVFTPADARRRIAPLPIERLWGVGPATGPRVRAAGFATFGDLASAPSGRVRALLGAQGLRLQALAQGRDDRKVVPESEAKSIGREVTFAQDTSDRSVLRATLYRLVEDVGHRLRRARLSARTVTLKMRFDTFETATRDVTLAAASNLDEVLFSKAWRLVGRMRWASPRVRLIGVSTSNFETVDSQLQLFNEADTRGERVARALDRIRDHWGPSSIGHAGALAPMSGRDRGHG